MFIMYRNLFILAIVITLGWCQERLVGKDSTNVNGPVVSIQFKHKHVCTGAAFKTKYVITSASCIMKYINESLEVRVGSTNHNSGGTILYVKKIGCIEQYNAIGNKNDYAVLLIDQAFPTTVKGVTIPKNSVESNLRVLGWDISENSKSVIKTATVTLLDHDKCVEQLGTAMVGSTIICSKESIACDSDMGGPMFQSVGSTNQLQGIVSSNRRCFTDPTIYTNVVGNVGNAINKCVTDLN